MDEVEKSVQAKDCKNQSKQIARNDRCRLHLSSPLNCLRVRLHDLKVGGEKGIAVPPLIQRGGSACREESRICHTEEAKDRPQVGLDKVETRHPRLPIIDPASRDDE